MTLDYKGMQKKQEVIRFVIVGVVATALHYGIYYLMQLFINVNIAYTIGYVMSFILNFYVSSHFTFRVKPSWGRLLGMVGAHGINYILSILFLNIFLYFNVPKTVAPFPVFALVIPINFILVRTVFNYKRL